MKKLLALFLTVFLALGVCACDLGGSGKTSDKKPSASEVGSASDSVDASVSGGGSTHSVHMDDDGDGVCDICGERLAATVGEYDGSYKLTEKIVDGRDMTGTYVLNKLEIEGAQAVWYEVDIAGVSQTNFTCDASLDGVTLSVGFRELAFSYDKEGESLVYSGRYGGHNLQLTFVIDKTQPSETESGQVNFNDQLFGDDINENFYNYCPSIMIEGNDTMHIWYCSNEISGNVTDFIAYRKGKLTADGKWTFTEKKLVLSAGRDGEWDSRHACDPTVVKGKFEYNGENYNYLMAYLGCLTSNGAINEVGVAVAKKPEGPWVKYGGNPIANFRTSIEFNSSSWGYGQPSLVSVDRQGKVILFYTKGITSGTFTYAEMWDLSNLNAPVKMKEGKLADGGEIEVLNNADFAYDPVSGNFYCIKEDHIAGGWYPDDGGVNWIGGSVSLFCAGMKSTDEYVGDSLFAQAPWTKVTTVGKALTGFARNHNAGLVTDEYGWLMYGDRIPVVYTMSMLKTDFPDWEAGGQWPALHTYRLHGIVLEK